MPYGLCVSVPDPSGRTSVEVWAKREGVGGIAGRAADGFVGEALAAEGVAAPAGSA